MNKDQTLENGFTLIEMLICIIVVAIGVIAVFSVTSKYSKLTIDERNNLVASYLAQEGIEIVKNVRDYDWTTGATYWNSVPAAPSTTLVQLCAGGCEADWLSNPSDSYNTLAAWTDPGRYLLLDNSTGLYQYVAGSGGGVTTQYKRKIIITQDSIGSDGMDIEVDVTWETYQVTVKEQIYNWKPND